MADYKFSTQDEQDLWTKVFLSYFQETGFTRSIEWADNAAQALLERLPLEDEPEDSLALEAEN